MKQFKFGWWIFLLVLFTFWMSKKGELLSGNFSGLSSTVDIIMLLIWLALFLWPIFGEIGFFGINLKKELGDIKSEVREIRNSITVRSSQQLNINLNTPPYTDQNVDAKLPQVVTTPIPAPKELSEDSLKVLATLWKHQQEYDPQRWMFAIGHQNPNYRTFIIGFGETLKIGLTDYSPENGMIFLTQTGIDYCKGKQDLPPDWDYERWQKYK